MSITLIDSIYNTPWANRLKCSLCGKGPLALDARVDCIFEGQEPEDLETFCLSCYKEALISPVDLITTKICARCRVKKSINCFFRTKLKKDGHHPTCKFCLKRYEKKDQVKERRALYRKEYRLTHKEEFKKLEHDRFQRDKEKRMALNAEWRKKHPEKIHEYCRKWYQKQKTLNSVI